VPLSASSASSSTCVLPAWCATAAEDIPQAIGIQRQWPWQAILIVGTPLQNIGLAAPLVCATSYAIDIYKQYAGEVSLSMNVYGNVRRLVALSMQVF
jgi:hypothetical protein